MPSTSRTDGRPFEAEARSRGALTATLGADDDSGMTAALHVLSHAA